MKGLMKLNPLSRYRTSIFTKYASISKANLPSIRSIRAIGITPMLRASTRRPTAAAAATVVTKGQVFPVSIACFPQTTPKGCFYFSSNGARGARPVGPVRAKILEKIAEKRAAINSRKKRTYTQYLAGLSNFNFVRDRKSGLRSTILDKKDNLQFAANWVKKRLITESKIKSVADISSPSVLALRELAESDDIVRMLIQRMFDEAGSNLNYPTITDLDSLLIGLETCLTYAPEADVTQDTVTGDYSDNSVTTPLALLYGPLAMTESGEALAYYPAMNEWWKQYLTEWQVFLDSSESKYVLDKWLDEPAFSYLRMHEYSGQTVDDYSSWNDFFVRQLNFADPTIRPIDNPTSNESICSACDAAVWHCEEGSDMSVDDTFWIKEQPYDLKTLLRNDSDLINRYVGGTILQTVLFPDDYHRWMAPVSGVISNITIVGSTYWSNINYTLSSDDSDLQAWTGAVPFMSHLNVRCMIEIDTSGSSAGNIGKMLFIGVGLNEISTVRASVNVGDTIVKGETELGLFLYGGSTVIYLFEPNVIDTWSIKKPNNGSDPHWDPVLPENQENVQVGQEMFAAKLK